MSKRRNLGRTHKYSSSNDTGTGSLCMQVESDQEDNIETVTQKVDIQQLCRLCAEKCTVATSTSLLKPNPTLVYQLLHYFGIMIIPNDGMPTRVCRVCTHDLSRFETMKSNVNKAQKYLQLHLEMNQSPVQEDSDFEMFDEESEQEMSQVIASLENSLEELVSKEKETTSQSYTPFTPTPSVPNSSNVITTKIVSAKFIPMKRIPTLNPKPSTNSTPNPSVPLTSTPAAEPCAPVPSTSKPVNQAVEKKKEGKIRSLNGEEITLGLNSYVALDSDNNYECTVCKCSYTSYMKFLEHYESKHCEGATVEGNMVMNRKDTMALLKNAKKLPISYKFAFPCSICSCKYRQSFELAKHLQKHFAANRFLKIIPCPYCLIVFRKIGLLIDHMEKHITAPEEAAGFQCEVCQKQFLRMENLKHHMNMHTEVKKFSCSYCDKQYKFKNQLGNHMNIHRSEALANAGIDVTDSSLLPTCGLCLQFFNAYEDVISHVKESHASESKFQCGNCSSICKDLVLFVCHVQVKHMENTNKEMFSCTICRRDFDNKSILKRHFTNIHSTKTIHDCKFCKLIFTDISLLEAHVATYHPVMKPKKPVRKARVPNVVIPKVINIPSAVIPCEIEKLLNEYEEEEKEFDKQCKIVEANLKEISDVHGKDLLDIDTAIQEDTLDIEDDNTFLAEEELQENEMESTTLPDELHENSYPCGICQKKFFDSETFESHTQDEMMKMSHKQVPCGVCGVMFRKLPMLVSHLEKHMSNPGQELTIACKICSRRFQNRHNLNSHVLSHSEHRRFKCKLCPLRYRHKITWKKHMAFAHVEFTGPLEDALEYLPLVLDESGTRFVESTTSMESTGVIESTSNVESMIVIESTGGIENTLDVNSTIVFESTIIDKSLISNEISNNSYSEIIETSIKRCRSNTNIKKEFHYSCGICNIRYVESSSLLKHYEENHFDGIKLTCDFCFLPFTTTQMLYTHLAEHSKERNHFCPVCGKGFKLRQIMTEHINLHSMERKFQCEKCIRSYRSRTSLTHHQRRDHDNIENTFMCEYCSRLFTTKSHLRRHLFTHTGDSPFICRTCGKVCYSIQRLKDHEYTHGNIKPFHCLKCQKGFISQKHWRNHMRRRCNVPENEINYVRPRFHVTAPLPA